MRILKPVPVYKGVLVVPSGSNGDEVTSAESIVRIFTPLHNNLSFIKKGVEALYNKMYRIEDTQTTDSQTTNINQLPIRVEAQQPVVFMSNRSISELVTVRFNRQTYLNKPIKFLIKNIDKSLSIGSHIYSIGPDFVKIMIKRTADFYGYGNLVLEMQSDTGESLSSTLLNLRCDPLADAFKGEFSRKDAWIPAIPTGTTYTPPVLIEVPSNIQQIDLSNKSSKSIVIPVTLSGLSYVGIRSYTTDSAIKVELENTSLTSSGVVGLTIQNVLGRGVATSDIIFEGFSAVYGYVSTVVKLQIKLSANETYPLISGSVGDLMVNSRILSKLPALANLNEKLRLQANAEGDLVIPSHTILSVIDTPYAVTYSHVNLSLAALEIQSVPTLDTRPAVIRMTRISQLQHEKVYGGDRQLGYRSYYVGTIAPVVIELPEGAPTKGEISLRETCSLTAPNGLGYHGKLDTSPYSFKYDKTPS